MTCRHGQRATGGSRRPRSRPGDGHRRRRRRGPGAADPSGTAGEQLVEPVALDHVQGMAIGAGGAEHLVTWIRPARPASSWWSTSTSITPAGGHRRRRRRGAGDVNPSGAAGEQLVEPVDLDHVQGEGLRRRRRRTPGDVDPSGAAGEQLVEHVDLDHSCRWPSAPAAPSTWWRGSFRHGRRAAGGARRPRSRLGDGHRRRRRQGPGGVDPSGAAGEHLVEPVDLDHVQGMATGAVDLVY